jgi:chemotaxis signal transduction protein
VTGECELATCNAASPANNAPEYVTAVLARGDELIPVVDLAKLISGEVH